MKRIPVESAVVKAIGYDQAERVLEIEFPNGNVYQYADVSLSEWNAFEQAKSKGQWFNTNVRGKLVGKRVEPKPEPEPADYSPSLEKSLKNAAKTV